MLYKSMTFHGAIHELSDNQLIDEVARIVKTERAATAGLIACLAEFDKRRLHLGLGYSSLFAYCTQALHLSEDAAFSRIEAARAARKFPIVIAQLAAGDLTLTAVRLLAPHLTTASHKALLTEARHKSKREVEHLVAKYRPLPPLPSTIRQLPALRIDQPPTPQQEAHTAPCVCDQPPASLAPMPPSRRPLVTPLSDESYRLQITMSRATHDKLRKAQALMRHRIPSGDPATIFDNALDALLREIERVKCARVNRPRPETTDRVTSRAIPASIRRAVWKRDEARCVFEGKNRQRCGATDFLEYHHVVPYARGGKATVENIQLRCRAHNAYEAEQDFGLFVREDKPPFAADPAARRGSTGRRLSAPSIARPKYRVSDRAAVTGCPPSSCRRRRASSRS